MGYALQQPLAARRIVHIRAASQEQPEPALQTAPVAASHRPRGPASHSASTGASRQAGRQRGPPGCGAPTALGDSKGGPHISLQQPPDYPRKPRQAKRQAKGALPCPEREGLGRREGPVPQQPPPRHTAGTREDRTHGGGGTGDAETAVGPAEVAPLPSPRPTETHRGAADADAVAGPSPAASSDRSPPARARPARSRDRPARSAPPRPAGRSPRAAGSRGRGGCREA